MNPLHINILFVEGGFFFKVQSSFYGINERNSKHSSQTSSNSNHQSNSLLYNIHLIYLKYNKKSIKSITNIFKVSFITLIEHAILLLLIYLSKLKAWDFESYLLLLNPDYKLLFFWPNYSSFWILYYY